MRAAVGGVVSTKIVDWPVPTLPTSSVAVDVSVYFPSIFVARDWLNPNVGQYALPATASVQGGVSMLFVSVGLGVPLLDVVDIDVVGFKLLFVDTFTTIDDLSFVSTINCCGNIPTYGEFLIVTMGDSASIMTTALSVLVMACENCERAIRNTLAGARVLGVKVMSSMPPWNISLRLLPLILPPIRSLYAELVVMVAGLGPPLISPRCKNWELSGDRMRR